MHQNNIILLKGRLKDAARLAVNLTVAGSIPTYGNELLSFIRSGNLVTVEA